jgi:hypothetical protein
VSGRGAQLRLVLDADVPSPLVVAYGLGVDSTAMLVGMAARGIRPDLILFADTGSEKPETYEYLPIMQAFLRRVGFPAARVVRYVPAWTKNGPYTTLEENCLVNRTLPSLAFGRKGCSLKWKREPQDRFCRAWEPARRAWAAGGKVVKAIGYDAGPADSRRSTIADDDEYRYWYPLREWRWDRERCKAEIAGASLPVPVKSACFFCPASKPDEIAALCDEHPDFAERIVAIEERAQPGLTAIEGLWRRSTKLRPGRMAEFIRGRLALRVVG